MRKILEDVGPRAREEFSEEIDASDSLLTYVVGLLNPWGGRPLGEDESDTIIVSIFSRSVATFGAVVELSRVGFSDQMAMLNRSLFEDLVDAHWVSVEPDLAFQRLAQHDRHNKMLLADAARQHGQLIDDELLPTFTIEERNELDLIFGRFGDKSWTGLGLYSKVQAIEHLWEDAASRDLLHFVRRFIHRENNLTLHVSAFSMGRQITGGDDESVSLSLGPRMEGAGRSLLAGFWMVGQTVSLILDTFWPTRPPGWDDVYTNAWSALPDLPGQ